MLIDTNSFLGSWPFSPVFASTGAQLAAHLSANGVGCAMVSHLGAVFLPEPMPANRELFASVRGVRSLVPVPVINPALAAWRDHLEECCRAAPLRAVRIMPTYHDYTPRDRRLVGFMAALAERKLPLILQARLEDERNRYFGLTVKGARAEDLAIFLQRFPKHHVLCNGLNREEIANLAESYPNFSADFTFAEHLTTIETMLRKISPRRLVIGTGWPMLSVHAQTAKLRHARIRPRERALIASENVRRLFSL